MNSRSCETNSCQLARELLKYPNKSTAMDYLAMSRRNLRLITGILTGHCPLRKHLYNMKLNETPLCRGCEQEDETVHHVLCDYSAVSSLENPFWENVGLLWPM